MLDYIKGMNDLKSYMVLIYKESSVAACNEIG